MHGQILGVLRVDGGAVGADQEGAALGKADGREGREKRPAPRAKQDSRRPERAARQRVRSDLSDARQVDDPGRTQERRRAAASRPILLPE